MKIIPECMNQIDRIFSNFPICMSWFKHYQRKEDFLQLQNDENVNQMYHVNTFSFQQKKHDKIRCISTTGVITKTRGG